MIVGAIEAVIDVSAGSDGSGLYTKAEKVKDATVVYVVADITVLEDIECYLVIHNVYNKVDGNVSVILDWLQEKDSDYIRINEYFTPVVSINDYRNTYNINAYSFGKCTGAVIIKKQHVMLLENHNKSVKKALTTFKED